MIPFSIIYQMKLHQNSNKMNYISPKELKAKVDNNEKFQLIDVREEHDFEDFNIGGVNIPLGKIFSSLDKIDTDKPVILICNSGRKTAAIIHTINRKLDLNTDSIYTLKGGIPSYVAEYGDQLGIKN